MTTTAGQSYATAPNRLMHASNGIDYAYREIGTGTIPFVLLQHFRGNLENWDPPLLDALASERRVTAFDNVGIGATTGTTPNTMEQMAHDALSSSTHWRSHRSTSSGSPLAALSPRRSPSPGPTWYADLSWRPRHHEVAPGCTDGPRR